KIRSVRVAKLSKERFACMDTHARRRPDSPTCVDSSSIELPTLLDARDLDAVGILVVELHVKPISGLLRGAYDAHPVPHSQRVAGYRKADHHQQTSEHCRKRDVLLPSGADEPGPPPIHSLDKRREKPPARRRARDPGGTIEPSSECWKLVGHGRDA